ncbi:MAG: hypothetical protein KGN84_21960, partial [Acidobacteriota bacterium]|nr:hypothetical protein [Acidobacteriota bacterium]
MAAITAINLFFDAMVCHFVPCDRYAVVDVYCIRSFILVLRPPEEIPIKHFLTGMFWCILRVWPGQPCA